ncbi:glycosyltransferase [Ekhidna sp.]|uniref:glycosyltransferase n=1 Tax=Ekhidna sp. TaxID=2608089 RepID=UPI003BAD3053
MISIIIPTLNEEEYLRKTTLHTINKSFNRDELELIIVDAGSRDDTLESIKDLDVTIFSKPEFALKKFESLNYGVSKSHGELIIFLDADTLLPNHFDDLIESKMRQNNVVGGAFEFAFERPDWKLSLVTILNRIRYRFGKIFYGDQAVFVKKEVLDEIGGVPEEPLMETAYLCKALRKRGKLTIIRPALKTSARRFKTYGFFNVAWFDLNMLIRFNLGLSVSSYAKKYWGKNLKT